ncbi:MAG TPA: MBG domain-containing protein [Pyrinomonadaceae bacterium]|nr:MBG domain-containing protein [Pyrinomonadaceae bacterium]
MIAPNRSTSLRLLSTRTIRFVALIAGAAMVLSSTSFAGSLSQRLFASATTIVSGGQTSNTHAHTASPAFAAAAVENTTMSVERRGHTATRLADGRVLIAGGDNSSGALNQSELYDPAAATFSASANMSTARADHSATLLADGRVLIAGGRNGGASLDSTEIFDPATGAFTSGPSMSAARAGHSATLLANGRVLVAGGNAGGTAEVFDPAAGTFTAAGSLGVARSMHSAALLQDGRVLLVGGRDASGNELTSGEIFDTPASAFWTVDNALKVTRVRAHLRVLFDGKVQIIGGNNDGSMEVYDPVFEGFGAYAHVLPESDPCTGLSGQILNSQTRAALFHNGQTDALLDRSGHTITELNGQALVLGGVNSSGAVLSSSAVLGSSSASITTDYLDYAPGDIARISGRGFQPGEVVRLKIHEDPHTPQERGFDVTADAEGNFSGEYLVMDYDLNMKFIVGSRGLSSGRTAQTTFTDARNLLLTFAGTGSGTVTVTPNTGTVNAPVSCGGTGTNAASQTVSTTCLPNITTSDNGAIVTFNAVANVGSTFGGWSGQAGLSSSTCTGTTNPCSAVLGGGPTLTVTFNGATVNTTTTVANASATYGDTSVTLNATVTPASGPAVNNGSVTFTVKQGLTTIGAATTDNTVVAGAASVSYALPAGTDAGPYTIEASYTPGTGFNASSGTGTLTINKRAIEVTADAGQFKIYGDADPTFTYTITSGSLVPPDAFTGALSRVAGENVGLYAITIGTLAINDGNGGNNYNLTFVSNNFEIKKRAIEVTADAGQFKIYGDPDPAAFTYSITSGSLAFSDTFTGALSRVAGENVGLYAITIGTLAINDGNGGNNYNLTFVSNNFEIKKRPATWTTDPASKTYGDPDPVFTGSGSNFLAGDGVTATYSRVAGENASPPTYHITATLSATPLSALDNYIITNNGAEFTINKRAIQVTADAGQFKIYGDPDPTFTYTLTSGTLAFSDTFTGALSRAAGQNVGLYAITIGSLTVNDGNGGNNYNLTFVSKNFEIKKRPITVKADPQTKTFGDPDPVFTYQITSGSLAFSDTFTGALSRAPGELVGTYAINIGTLAISDGNGGNNYTLTFVPDNLTILTACSVFNGFLSPINGSIENGNGGTFADPVRAFKLNSTIPVKFNAICFGVPLTTGIHTLQAIKYSNSTDSDPAIDATPTDAATTGNQFRLTGTEWHFNMNTKALGGNAQGTYLLKATLFDGSVHSVWVSIKK